MREVRVAQFENSFVIHFVTENRRINAYTLASTLVGLADAAKAANASVNPGHNIEIVVEALGSGSFRAKISAVLAQVYRHIPRVQQMRLDVKFQQVVHSI